MSDTVLCPACQKVLPVKGIPKHTNGCAKWQAVIGVPPSQFNFNRHFKRALYADGLQEGVDYVECRLCDFRAKRLMDHLQNVHKLDEAGYLKAHPDAQVRLSSTLQSRVATVQARYGTDNVFQTDEVKAKSRETAQVKYGVDHASLAPAVVEKREQTNRERYGVSNVFSSKEIQDKAVQTMLSRYGVSKAQQLPRIRLQTAQTNLARYGAEAYFQTPQFAEQYRRTSQVNWGSDHPMQSEAGQQRCEEGCLTSFGYSNPFHSPEIQEKAYQSNLANHGGKHSQQDPDVLEKARATWMEKYGEDNPSKVEAVKQRIKDVWEGKYGVPFPPQSLWTNRVLSFPNKLEQYTQTLCPVNVIYAGDGSYWVKAKGESRARNPDFVVLTDKQLALWQEGAKLNDLRVGRLVEIFGSYWHGPARTGKERSVHQAEVVDYYKRAGLECLVLWEDEIRKHPQRVAERIQVYLGISVSP